MVKVSKLYEDRYGQSSKLDFSKMIIPDLLESIISRASIRKFSDKPISKELLTLLLTAAQSAPSKSNLQQYSILIMQDKMLKLKVGELIGETKWALSSPVFLLFLADIRRNMKVTKEKGYEYKNNNIDTFMNAVIDASLSMQSLICAAEASGLGVCPISMIRNIIDEIKILCKLPKGVFPIAGLAIGWPAEKAPVSIRMPQSITIHNDYYNEEHLNVKINDYDERVYKIAPITDKKQRHVNIYGVSEKGTWSENVARQLSVPERNDFRKWLKSHGFKLE
jgi:nitroreductase